MVQAIRGHGPLVRGVMVRIIRGHGPLVRGCNGAGNSRAWPARTGCYGARDSGFTCVDLRRRLLRYINLSDSAVRVL